MLIGYMRVSTGEQNLDLQRDALDRAGCNRIFDDVCSGRTTERPGLDKAIDIAVQTQSASVSMIQRRLRVGYTRAGRLVDMLERRGIVSGYEGIVKGSITLSATSRSMLGEDRTAFAGGSRKLTSPSAARCTPICGKSKASAIIACHRPT